MRKNYQAQCLANPNEEPSLRSNKFLKLNVNLQSPARISQQRAKMEDPNEVQDAEVRVPVPNISSIKNKQKRHELYIKLLREKKKVLS